MEKISMLKLNRFHIRHALVNAGVKARIYAAELFGVEGDQMATT